ncbi:MAG: response regulator [Candidatus Hydrogenedentes bacterium]|nr:response regulator [Candidatus Hydrogenedentota bacterium]
MDVLVAEDDKTTRVVIEKLLVRWGFSVKLACDGTEAWDIIEDAQTPMLAVLDWLMPNMTGPEVCAKVVKRRSGPFIYMVLLTAKEDDDVKSVGLNAGAHAFMRKPFNPDELQSCLRVGERVIQYESELREKNVQLQEYATLMENLAEERARQLTQAERMATLGLLAAGVAHEVNNPSTFISGNAQTLEQAWSIVEKPIQEYIQSGTGDVKQIQIVLEEVPKMLEGIQEGVRRITRITEGLKSFACQGGGDRRVFLLDDVVTKALDLCHNQLKYHVTVEKSLSDDQARLYGDAQQIEQVLVNLFVNAAQAMKSRGTGVLRVSTRRDGPMVEIKVEDDGPGFPEGVVDEIFKPFFTTKSQGEGTGLGLSISQGIVEDHEGTIWAENRRSGGARFVLRFPVETPGRAEVHAEVAGGHEEREVGQ